jgi:hypothetical protein
LLKYPYPNNDRKNFVSNFLEVCKKFVGSLKKVWNKSGKNAKFMTTFKYKINASSTKTILLKKAFKKIY